MTATAPSNPAQANPYETDLDRNAANYVPLSPLSFLARTAATFPDRLAVAHGKRRYTWVQTAERCRRLASALAAMGVAPGDVLTFAQGNTVRVVRVIAHGTRRGPAPEAQTLYADLTPAPPPQEDVPSAPQPQDGGRPTKKDRRIFDLDRRRMLE